MVGGGVPYAPCFLIYTSCSLPGIIMWRSLEFLPSPPPLGFRRSLTISETAVFLSLCLCWEFFSLYRREGIFVLGLLVLPKALYAALSSAA